MVQNEAQLWKYLKNKTPQIEWTKIENTSHLGTPDLLGYNKNKHFFTVELKVSKGNRLRFSPHQIAFHFKHPKDSYILVKTPVPRSVKLYPGSAIRELVNSGPTHPPLVEGWDAIKEQLEA